MAEEILIGVWLKGECLEDLQDVDPKDFAYQKVVNLLQQGKDAVEISKLAGVPIAELLAMTTHNPDVFYRQAIYAYREQRLRRKLAGGEYSFDEVKQEIAKLEGTLGADIQPDKNYAEQYMQELGERKNRVTVRWAKLPSLQYMTDGIKPKELTTIAARPSVGKSAFALQAAVGAAEQGKKVLYFPLEMSKAQTFDRILQSQGFDSRDLRSGRIINGSRYAEAMDIVDSFERSGNFKIYEGKSNIGYIEAAVKTEKPFLVVIDQLTQLRGGGKFNSIRERFSYMTSTLKAMAMQENVAVILLAQVNRSAQRIEPTMAELKESGSIEEDSDNVIILHRPQEQDGEFERIQIKLAKQRDGETGEIEARFNKQKMIFFEKG